MESYGPRIVEIALRLLSEERVDAVLGFQRGTVPMMNQPILIHHPEEADQLHWDSRTLLCPGPVGECDLDFL